MDKHRRAADKAHKSLQKAASRGEAVAFALPLMGEPMRDLVAAGGLRGFSPRDIFPERAA